MATPNINVKVTADTSKFHKELEVVENRLKAIREDWHASGPIGKLFTLFKGRCTFFAILFSTVGIILAFMGKLTPEFVALVGAIQALLVAHSLKEDMADLQTQKQQNQNTTVVNVETK